jgi:hypothetical protein
MGVAWSIAFGFAIDSMIYAQSKCCHCEAPSVGQGTCPDGSGDLAPTDGSGDLAPTDGSGDLAPTDGSGDLAPTRTES